VAGRSESEWPWWRAVRPSGTAVGRQPDDRLVVGFDEQPWGDCHERQGTKTGMQPKRPSPSPTSFAGFCSIVRSDLSWASVLRLMAVESCTQFHR